MRQLITRFIYSALIALSVISCSITETGEGYLCIDLESAVDTNIEMEPATKAEVEASENYIIDIGGTQYRYGDIKSTPISLQAGTYTVQAYNCTQAQSEEGTGSPRFASETVTIEVQVGQTQNLSLKCTMANTRFTFSYDQAFGTEFDTSSTTLEVSSTADFSGRTITLSSVSDELYFTSGESVYVRISAYKKGHNTPHTLVLGPYVAQAATSHNISINYAAPVLNLTPSVAHTYSDGYLTGTAITFTVASFSGINPDKFASWGVEVKDGSGNLIHTHTSTNTPSAESPVTISRFNGPNYNGWIYLPQGTTCTVGTPYVILKTGEKVYCTGTSTGTTYTVPAPTFSVNIHAETSYSRYRAGSSNANDSGTGDQVMNIGATVTISNEILDQMGGAIMVFQYNGLDMLTDNKITTNSISPQTLKGYETMLVDRTICYQARGVHNITASLKFDGVEKSSNLPCHVTGIPYEESLNKNTNGWTNFSNVETDNGYFIFNTDEASVLSPAFHIPASIDVTVTLAVYAYHTNATRSYNPTVWVAAASEPAGKSGESANISSSINTVGVAGCNNKDFNVQMTTSNKKISLYVYGKNNSVWYGVDFPEFFMNKFSLKYR